MSLAGACEPDAIVPGREARFHAGSLAEIMTYLRSLGGGTIGYFVAANTGVQRTGTIINFGANQVIPNAFVVGLSTDGKFNIYSHGATHFIVDLNGYFAP